MNEFSFINFSDTITDECGLALPCNNGSDLRFFVNNAVDIMDLTDKDGTVIAYDISFSGGLFITLAEDLSTYLSNNNCFRLKLSNVDLSVTYSNLLRYVANTTETTLLKYICYEPQFGFDYSIENSFNQVRLPILIKNPNFPQEDNIYIDGNGVRRVLFSKIDSEYELETEYMPVEWHEKLVVALGHDEVYFDGVRYQKSSPYEIDYEEYDELPCGTRLYKASAKVTKNTTIRNNNC